MHGLCIKRRNSLSGDTHSLYVAARVTFPLSFMKVKFINAIYQSYIPSPWCAQHAGRWKPTLFRYVAQPGTFLCIWFSCFLPATNQKWRSLSTWSPVGVGARWYRKSLNMIIDQIIGVHLTGVPVYMLGVKGKLICSTPVGSFNCHWWKVCWLLSSTLLSLCPHDAAAPTCTRYGGSTLLLLNNVYHYDDNITRTGPLTCIVSPDSQPASEWAR